MQSALLILILLLHSQAAEPAQPPDDSLLPDGQQQFVAALHGRHMFDLAAQHCQRQQATAVSRNQQALWQLLMADGCELQLPLMPARQRPELVTKAATDITEFLNDRPPGPVTDLLLQIRRTELLATAARTECLPELLTLNPSHPPQTPLQLSARRKQFALDASQQGAALADAGLQQLDLLRADLEPSFLRSCRLRLRFVLASCLQTRCRLATAAEIPGLLTQLDEQAEQLVRSSGSADRLQARLLQADALLDRRDFAAFQLQLRRLQPDVLLPADQTASAVLQWRALLLQNQPSDALQASVKFTETMPVLPLELQLLRAHALLRLHESLLLLRNSSPERQQSLLSTATEFQQRSEKLLLQTSGVLHEATLRLKQRFELSLQVGPAAATTLEQINEHITATDYQSARSKLRHLAEQSEQQSVKAYALMQAGELSLRLSDWAAASTELQQASEGYRELQSSEQAASADLLRLYCLGQLWNTASATEKTARQNNYRDAVEQHLKDYAEQKTEPAARLYRIRYLRSEAPLSAAADVLQLLQSPAATPPVLQTDRTTLLCLLADLLLEHTAFGTPPTDSAAAADVHAQRQRLTTAFQEQIGQTPSAESPANTSLALLQSAAILWQTPVESTPIDWSQLARSTDAALALPLPEVQPEAASESAELLPRGRTAAICTRLLAACRLLEPDTLIDPLQQSLLNSPPELRRLALQLLSPQLTETTLPGHSQLGRRLSSIHQTLHNPADSLEQRLQWLQLETTFATAAGNTEPLLGHLTELLLLPLTPAQLSQLSGVAGSLSVRTSADPSARRTLVSFWQKLRNQSRPGDDLWLEASLRLAESTAIDGRRQDALRMLQVVNVLHPEWGRAERKQRAAMLQKQLESAP